MYVDLHGACRGGDVGGGEGVSQRLGGGPMYGLGGPWHEIFVPGTITRIETRKHTTAAAFFHLLTGV